LTNNSTRRLYDEKYDFSKAPGSWYEMKSGAYAGKKIHYVELDHETTGPSKGTFVLVGGLRYHAEQWNETQFVDTLRKRGYKVVVVDVPGQGWTHLRELAENGSKPGNIRVPLRYDKEDQAQVVQELLTSLRENNRIGENTHLVGISYGGWLASYISTLPQFDHLFKQVALFDPGMGNTTHLAPGVDDWNKTRNETVRQLKGLEYMISDNVPEAVKAKLKRELQSTIDSLPKKPPGATLFLAASMMRDQTATMLKKSIFPLNRLWGQLMEQLEDIRLQGVMDSAYPKKYKNESAMRYSGAAANFNGIRTENMVLRAGEVRHPTHMIQSGNNGGIVPHVMHQDFVENNPNTASYSNLVDAEHDSPAKHGVGAATIMVDSIEAGARTNPTELIDVDKDTGKPISSPWKQNQ
jgi:pimeloyl-ACP methyl ester carboxylesterase